MLWTLIVLLMLFWLLGFAFDVAGGIIHVLLVIALVLFLVNLISGRRRSFNLSGFGLRPTVLGPRLAGPGDP